MFNKAKNNKKFVRNQDWICENCANWSQNAICDDFGECRKRSPIVDAKNENRRAFPVTKFDDWCAGFHNPVLRPIKDETKN